MSATKRSADRSISSESGRALPAVRRRRSESSEIKAEIEALMRKIERELIALNARADRLLAETKVPPVR